VLSISASIPDLGSRPRVPQRPHASHSNDGPKKAQAVLQVTEEFQRAA
jgi:hypothetical protein